MMKNRNEILDVVIVEAQEAFPILDGVEFHVDDYFVDLGANSIDRTVLADKVLTRLLIEIPLVEIIGAMNAIELADLIFEKQPQRPKPFRKK